MTNNIFSEYAPKYWAAGISVIPLKKFDDPSAGRGKSPFLSEWTAYGREIASKTVQDHWLISYPDCNIGLALGEASNLCCIDIDSEDEEVASTILSALPPSPWKRVGRKGMALIYKWSGQKNFKLRDSDNKSIVEFLGQGNQVVLPPSIHPDTRQPYVADTNLWDVLDKICELPTDIENVFRVALEPIMGERGLTLANTGRSRPLEVVPQGERDIQMIRHAGYLARVVLGIDRSQQFTLMEAINHMATWVEEYTARVAGDSMDSNKGVAKLLEFLVRDLERGKTLPDGWDEGLTLAWEDHPTIEALRSGNEVARWDTVKANAWLTERLEMHANEPREQLKCVFELIESVAADDNFTELEFGMVCNDIIAQLPSKFRPSKPDLKRAFKDARKGDTAGEALDQAEIADQALEILGRSGEVRHDVGYFWQWNGSCFERLDDEQVEQLVFDEIKGNVLCRRNADYRAVVNIMRIKARKPLVEQIEPGINFANGYLTIDGKLFEHSPKWGATFTMPFNYVPERAGECHKWLEFLESCWGEDDDYTAKVAALQEAFAATMFSRGTRFQKAILLYGKAGTGKSVTLEVLQEMLPDDAVCSVPPHQWREKYALPTMVGKSLNVCGELPESKAITGDIFKEIIEGREGIQIEQKYKEPFAFTPRATHWFASNYLPRSRDWSRGFARRWQIFEFNRVVPSSEIIRDYAKILVADEREAIAAWAVQGLVRLEAQRDYTCPASHDRQIAKMTRQNNSVVAWLSQTEKVRPEEGAYADALECYDQYLFYSKEVARSYGVAFERFKSMISELGYDEEVYKDLTTGADKYKFRGLRVVEPTVESKWGLKAHELHGNEVPADG